MHADSFSLSMPTHLCDVTMFYAAHSGGVRRYIETKHEWLCRHTRVRHSVVAPGAKGVRLAPYQCALPAWPLPFCGDFRFPFRIRPWVEFLERLSPDLIEAGDPYRLGWAAIEAGQRLGVPVTGFYHSDLPKVIAVRLGKQAGRAAERYVRHLYSNVDLALAPSRAVQRELQQLGVWRTRIQPLGVDTDCFHPRLRSERLRRELRLKPDTRLLIFAGRNAREKHIDSLIESVGRLGPRCHLLLVGPGMPQPGVRNATAFSRFANSRELASLLASSDALIHAGDAETFGLVVLEAMASGIPVIGVDKGAVPELVTPATGVLARSSAPGHLAEAIVALFEQDVRNMGRAARRAVEMQWTWNRTFRGLLATYDGLLSPRLADVSEGLIGAAG